MIIKNSFSTVERNDFSEINCHWWYGGKVHQHLHLDYYEIVIATKNAHTHIIDGERFVLNNGDVLFLSPNIAHEILRADDARHYNIAVKSSLFEKITANKTSVKKALNKKGYLSICPSETAFNFINECIQKIDNLNFGTYSYTLAETILSILFLSLMSHNDENDGSVYCLDAINKIENGSFIDKSASEIYALYPLSHTSFINEFKRITGKAPSVYLTERKLNYAKTLLTTTSLSVLEIAEEVGFSSVSHFIKVFQQAYGKTPLKYRKS